MRPCFSQINNNNNNHYVTNQTTKMPHSRNISQKSNKYNHYYTTGYNIMFNRQIKCQKRNELHNSKKKEKQRIFVIYIQGESDSKVSKKVRSLAKCVCFEFYLEDRIKT